MKEFGFVAAKSSTGSWYSWPATRLSGVITAHDVSGFSGSWVITGECEFFPRVSESVFCGIASKQATDYCISKEQP